jgi:glycogen debranching enzyme
LPQKTEHDVRVLDGTTFFVSDTFGDAYGTESQGLFYKDTRFLSQCILKVNGVTPYLLSKKEVDYFSIVFYMTMPYKDVFEEHALTIVRDRIVGRGAHEHLLVHNFSCSPQDVEISLQFGTDFADLFEIKTNFEHKIERLISTRYEKNAMVFSYDGGHLQRETVITFDKPGHFEADTLKFHFSLNPKEEWELSFTVAPFLEKARQLPKYVSIKDVAPEMEKSMSAWLGAMPELDTNMDYLVHALQRSVIDLAALRFYPTHRDAPVLAAGLPWFMALFGRDNCITSYQCAMMAPQLGRDAIVTLARRQGTEYDDFRDEEPGKIVHEVRYGEMSARGAWPTPYYGSVDSTPLFLILLHEIYSWTGDVDLVRDMKDHALRALEWIDKYGDLDGDGFIEYKTRSTEGLVNQGWKDSWNAIRFSNEVLAEPPIALCEVQGYVYDAKLRTAELARKVWDDPALADRLEREAADLKKRFNEAFWIDSRGGFYALALDAEKRQVDSLTSNMGQLLWSGIVDEERAPAVVRQLFSHALFSGWGVRTMSSHDRAYNPISYHCGTVWPHDNSLIAAGLARYGYRAEANRIIESIIDASHYFRYRLPEVYGGYNRMRMDYPVEYPTASQPQAWATGTPILFLRTMLGITPDPHRQTINADPKLPKSITRFALTNLHLFGKRFDIFVENDVARIQTS